jgi:regulator of protease activity HflC (stomatin/prohibitin superfamily)
MNELWIVVILLAAVLGMMVLKPARTTVFEYERGLKFTRGRFKGVLSPGSYIHSRAATVIQRIDTRSTRIAVAGQEVLTSDGVAIKTSIAAAYHVADPAKAVLSTESYQMAIHTELQLALRAIASAVPIEDLLKRRAELPAQLKEIAAPRLREIGIELEDASLRDLTFPGELKKIFAQVVRARQEGLAALEKARGETAALRNLANAAQMIERSPSLMQLRALQVLAQQPGNTLVLGMSGGTTPIPLRTTTEPQIPPVVEPRGDSADSGD